MEIKRTGPPNLNLGQADQRTEAARGAFKYAPENSADREVSPEASDVPAGVSRADLRDPQKAEQILRQYLSGALHNAIRNQGVSVADSQQHTILSVLQNDPVLREKLLRYLDHSAT